jgi:2-haloacid dehalogenase
MLLNRSDVPERIEISMSAPTSPIRALPNGVDHFRLPPEQIAFAAFGGWDVAGGKKFGYCTNWCNSLGAPEEVLDVNLDATGSGMAELPYSR